MMGEPCPERLALARQLLIREPSITVGPTITRVPSAAWAKGEVDVTWRLGLPAWAAR
jgi:hypothetical protein